MATILAEIFKHHLWANLGLIDACVALDAGQLATAAPGTYGTIGKTLVHLAVSDSGYVAAATGRSVGTLLPQEPFPGFETLRQTLRESGEQLILLAESEHNDRIVTGMRYGEAFSLAISVFMLQAVDHGTEHRTHIAASLTQLGIEPPELDGWGYAQRTAG